MTKKIAVINDLSGFGKCSLTAAISAVAAMGVQPCPLPTAVLSAQTGYPSYYCDDYTDRMGNITEEWRKMDVHFDGIYTGTSRMEAEMKALTERADIITPNLTELCLLTGRDCRLTDAVRQKEQIIAAAEEMARELMTGKTKETVVTGIRYVDEATGREMMGNLAVTEEGTSFSAFPFIGDSYSGTGDLFASIVAAGRARGDSLAQAMELAGSMIERAIEDAVRDGVPRNDGVEYERYLWMLGEKNRREE